MTIVRTIATNKDCILLCGQVANFLASAAITVWLASTGMNVAELLIATKVETVAAQYTMHMLTMHLAKR